VRLNRLGVSMEYSIGRLKYDSRTGEFYSKGRVVGNLQSKGYLQVCCCGKRYLAHRLAWFLVYGMWPKHQIDHIDNNKTNNRIDNLRDVLQSSNQKNRRLPLATSSTGHLGVVKRGNKYAAFIDSDGKQHYLGTHPSVEKAAIAYVHAKKKLHGTQQ
jgi:hypothetical protein